MSLRNRLPEVVRIKRKITDDPLQALVFENTRQVKRSKSSTFVFKLAKTYDNNTNPRFQDGSLLQPNELQDGISYANEKKTFLLLAENDTKEDEEDNDLPQELADMVKEYLQLEQKTSAPVEKKLQHGSLLKDVVVTEDGLEKDYVYDVYYRDKAIYDEKVKLGSDIGIIKFADEDLDLLNEDDENYKSDNVPLSDDEDSNAEDFYRNDYPDNEDDDKGIVIGNEDEWYSDEDDDDVDEDEQEDSGRRTVFTNDYGDESVLEKLKKEKKAFGLLSMDEVEYLYHEFYEDQNKRTMLDE